MREDINAYISALVRRNPGQMDEQEYTRVADELEARGPCAMLVFGVGNDTELWMMANAGGRTVFLEHDARWVEKAKERTQADIRKVKYSSRIGEAMSMIGCSDLLAMDLPEDVRGLRWDIVLVDAPPGAGGGGVHGRGQSIYEASRLVAPDGCVFVHDMHRMIERDYAKWYLGEVTELVNHLGVFGSKARRPA